ncbi:MAG: hypothetical protein BWY80_00146 [Firmicutes bacterium ADurb.Bin456]|nr:MAG: hypothetical protein BWY80_00146 [Firmicutes bacterium ADurb.Bin456]
MQPLEIIQHSLNLFYCFKINFFSFIFLQLSFKGGVPRFDKTSGYSPVLLLDKALDFLFPVGDQANCNGLHPAGAESFLYLAPKQRAQVVPNQAVQDAPGLLGVNPVAVNGPGVFNCVLNGLFSDFVEFYATGYVSAKIQEILQVPGNRFPFPVRVRGD